MDRGFAPLNWGSEVSSAPVCGELPQLALFWMEYSFGLNWKGMLPPAASEKPPPGLGSYSLSCSRVATEAWFQLLIRLQSKYDWQISAQYSPGLLAA